MNEPRSLRIDDQQRAAGELAGQVGQLLEQALLAADSSEPSLGDRMGAFAQAALRLRDEGVVTDDQVLELLSLFVAQLGEIEVSRMTSDLLDAAFETVVRHMNAGLRPPKRAASGDPMDVRAAFAWSG